MDGRTKSYREHRAKLEAARQRREAKKLDAVGKEGGISQMLQGFGLPEGVGIDSLFQSALQFSQQMLNGEEGGVNMSQILSGLGGGPLGNGPSGGPPGSGTNGGADNSNE